MREERVLQNCEKLGLLNPRVQSGPGLKIIEFDSKLGRERVQSSTWPRALQAARTRRAYLAGLKLLP